MIRDVPAVPAATSEVAQTPVALDVSIKPYPGRVDGRYVELLRALQAAVVEHGSETLLAAAGRHEPPLSNQVRWALADLVEALAAGRTVMAAATAKGRYPRDNWDGASAALQGLGKL